MTRSFGRFLVLTCRNSKYGLRARIWFYPYCGTWKEVFDNFQKDWGNINLSLHILKFRMDIYYRYGRKCSKGIPKWAQGYD